MSNGVEVVTPSGRRWLEPPADVAQLVAGWLAHHGIGLNMRCGGRGFCRGCMVEVAGWNGLHRTCQTRFDQLPPGKVRLTVPPASHADHTLHAVSDFEIRGTSMPPRARPGLGLAIDIGTTTVAAALWDLSEGACLATATRGNAQRRHGDDVVSRITFAVQRPEGGRRLQRALVADTLAPLVESLIAEAGVPLDRVCEAVVAGNPAMLHSFAGENLEGLATYPFRPSFLGARKLSAQEIGLPGEFRIQLLPGLGPFVGADVAAGACAAGLLDPGGDPVLLVDFGTNGELLLRTGDGFLAAAAAAGPAFEGGRLRHGATARAGVVSSMRIERGRWELAVIGGGTEAHGISGAAYVDFLAQALHDGLLDERGRFDPGRREVSLGEPAGQTGRIVTLGGGLDVSESDVAEILQAKAAIAGGIGTLLESAGLRAEDLAGVLVAGGFGYNLDIANALAIGLLPSIPADRIELLGNSSLGGASMILLAGQPDVLDGLVRSTRVIELNQMPSFEEHFTNCLALGPT